MDLLKVTVKHRNGESKEMYTCTSIITIFFRRLYRKWGEGGAAVTDKRIRGENCY